MDWGRPRPEDSQLLIVREKVKEVKKGWVDAHENENEPLVELGDYI